MKEKDAFRGEVEPGLAGRELDALVAETLGLPKKPPCARYHSTDEAEFDSVDGTWSGWCYTCRRSISEVEPQPLRYSTDIAAAWEVVEAVGLLNARQGGDLDFGWALQRNAAGEWEVRYRFGAAVARAESAPLAICRAALLFVEGREG